METLSIAEKYLNLQSLMEQLWLDVDYYLQNREMFDYSAPILEAAKVAEAMLDFIAEDFGYRKDSRGLYNANNINTPSLMTAFISNKQFPQECRGLLMVIRQIRNQAAHSTVGYENLIQFSKAFDCFILWFNNSKYVQGMFDSNSKRKFQDRIQSLEEKITKRLTDSINSSPDNSKKSSNVSTSCGCSFVGATAVTGVMPVVGSLIGAVIAKTEQSTANDNKESLFLRELDKHLQTLMTGMNMRFDNLESKVDNISEKLDVLSKQIHDYQGLVSRQLELAESEEEKDRIIHGYIDECVEKVVKENMVLSASSEKEVEAEKLRLTLGETAWNRLDAKSKDFLITSKIIFNRLILIKEQIDFSSVVLLVSKTVEYEIARRFCRDFISYLKQTLPGHENYKNYPTALLNSFGTPKKEKNFTLGNAPYLLDPYKDECLSEELRENNKKLLLEYCSAKLMVGKSHEEILSALLYFSTEIEDLTKDYRNPSAHTNQITKMEAEQCFNLVIDVEKLLKRMLESFCY